MRGRRRRRQKLPKAVQQRGAACKEHGGAARQVAARSRRGCVPARWPTAGRRGTSEFELQAVERRRKHEQGAEARRVAAKRPLRRRHERPRRRFGLGVGCFG
jgi:hypothetical protein